MVMEPPKNKADFYRRYHAGEFGNRPRSWATWETLASSGYAGNVTARSRKRAGVCHYLIPATEVPARVSGSPGEYSFNESMPDHLLAIQGNIVRSEAGLILDYSDKPGLTHRQAVSLARSEARMLAALGLLRAHLTPSSLDDLLGLLDDYPGAVIEFSAYRVNVGLLPHRNAVVWEVRAY